MTLRAARRISLAQRAAAHKAVVESFFGRDGSKTVPTQEMVESKARSARLPREDCNDLNDNILRISTTMVPYGKDLSPIELLGELAKEVHEWAKPTLTSLSEENLFYPHSKLASLLKEKLDQLDMLAVGFEAELLFFEGDCSQARIDRIIGLAETVTESCLEQKFLKEVDRALEEINDPDLDRRFGDDYLRTLLKIRLAIPIVKITAPMEIPYRFMVDLVTNFRKPPRYK